MRFRPGTLKSFQFFLHPLPSQSFHCALHWLLLGSYDSKSCYISFRTINTNDGARTFCIKGGLKVDEGNTELECLINQTKAVK